jgi:glycosyltransferase involved in cell wall biosynthesis
MEKPFFSIIIPTLNEEKFLPKLLQDLQHQKYRHFETIVVDGNSEDKTVSIARSFLKQIPIRISEVKKRHVSYQRNYGAALATGHFLIFLDADTRVNSTFLSKLHKELHKSKSVLFLPHYVSLDAFFQDRTVFSIFNFLISASQLTKKPFSPASFLLPFLLN